MNETRFCKFCGTLINEATAEEFNNACCDCRISYDEWIESEFGGEDA